MKIDKGKVTGSMLGKHMDPSGDFYVIEIIASRYGNELEVHIWHWEIYRDYRSRVKPSVLRKGNQSLRGHLKYCVKITGTYELKK